MRVQHWLKELLERNIQKVKPYLNSFTYQANKFREAGSVCRRPTSGRKSSRKEGALEITKPIKVQNFDKFAQDTSKK